MYATKKLRYLSAYFNRLETDAIIEYISKYLNANNLHDVYIFNKSSKIVYYRNGALNQQEGIVPLYDSK